MAARGCVLPKAQVARMMATARQTIADMKAAEADGWHRRANDPFERAKLALQRAGRVVFSHSLHVPGSTLIVVGTVPMEREQMMAYAQRFGRW